MSEYNIRLSNGTTVNIRSDEDLNDIKTKLAGVDANVFEGIDSDGNGKLDDGELFGLATKLQCDCGLSVTIPKTPKTEQRSNKAARAARNAAYNAAIQNMTQRYNKENLETNFKTDESDLVEVKSGDWLYHIAERALREEGLPTDRKSINERITQIALMNNLSNVNVIEVGMKLKVRLTEAAIQKVKNNNNDSRAALSASSSPQNIINNEEQEQPNPIKDEKSTVTVRKNEVDSSWGNGDAITSRDGYDSTDGVDMGSISSIKKYTKDGKTLYQLDYGNTLYSGHKMVIEAASEEELKKIHNSYVKVEALDTYDANVSNKAANLQLLKEAIEAAGGNEFLLIEYANILGNRDYFDTSSDEYKTVVKNLLLTRNSYVVKYFKEHNTTFTQDDEGKALLSNLYREIAEKEAAGTALTEDEIRLKETLLEEPYIKPTLGTSSINLGEKLIDESWTEDGEITDRDGFDNAATNINSIKKYTKDGVTKYQLNCSRDGLVIESDSLENLKTKYNDYFAIDTLTDKPANETADAKKTRQAENMTKFKKALAAADGDTQLVKYMISFLRSGDYFDKTSAEYKALIKDLLLTRNDEVISELTMTNDDGEMPAFKDNVEASKVLYGLYEEIRAKEDRGEKLTEDEIALKNTLKDIPGTYKINADTANEINGKTMYYSTRIDKTYYKATVNGKVYGAESPQLLDKFIKDLSAADNAEKKQALFKKYMNTTDRVLAATLSQNAKELGATDEDIKAFVNASDMYIINNLPTDENTTYSKDVVDTVVARIKTLYTEGAGDFKNAQYVEKAMSWIDKTDMTAEEKASAKKEVLDTFFNITKTTDSEGNEVENYTFNPSRRPTYEEMQDLLKSVSVMSSEMKEAIVEYAKTEEVEDGQFTKAVSEKLDIEPELPPSSITFVPDEVDETWEKGNEITDKTGFDTPHDYLEIYAYSKDGRTKYVVTESYYFGVSFEASTLEDSKVLYNAYQKMAMIGSTPASENATSEAKANNLKTAQEVFEVAKQYGNLEIVKELASSLSDTRKYDSTNDEYKTLVKELLLTRKPDVINNITYSRNSTTKMPALENDKQGTQILFGLYKEIRAKENQGETLTPDEVSLKGTLQDRVSKNGYKIPVDSDNGINEKYLTYSKQADTQYYTATYKNNEYYAADPELLDEFLNELKTAAEDNAKKALFKKYSTTEDKVLAACLAKYAIDLQATDEDLKTLVESNDMYVIHYLPMDELSSNQLKVTFERIKDLYLNVNPGDLNQARFLEDAKKCINEYAKNNEEININTELALISKTFFNVTNETDAEGNEEENYTFNPSRRPTYEEMRGILLYSYLMNEQGAAIADSIQLEDINNGLFTDAYNGQYEKEIADCYNMNEALTNKCGEFVENMSTKEEVLNFIEKLDDFHIPFDKIIEKFPEDQDVLIVLASRYRKDIDCQSIISDENKMKLLKNFVQVSEDNKTFTFDKTNLPDGVTFQNLISMLPYDCTKDEAAEIAKVFLNQLDLSNEDIIRLLWNHKLNTNDKDIMNKIKTLVNGLDKIKDKELVSEFITSICEMGYWEKLASQEKEKVYNFAPEAQGGTATTKQDLINRNFNKGGALVVVKKGNTLDSIIKNYLKTHLDKFPKLKSSVESDSKKWTEDRINEALTRYVADFRDDIIKDLGLTTRSVSQKDADGKEINSKIVVDLKKGQIIDLTKVKWEDHQPGWWNYNLKY